MKSRILLLAPLLVIQSACINVTPPATGNDGGNGSYDGGNSGYEAGYDAGYAAGNQAGNDAGSAPDDGSASGNTGNGIKRPPVRILPKDIKPHVKTTDPVIVKRDIPVIPVDVQPKQPGSDPVILKRDMPKIPADVQPKAPGGDPVIVKRDVPKIPADLRNKASNADPVIVKQTTPRLPAEVQANNGGLKNPAAVNTNKPLVQPRVVDGPQTTTTNANTPGIKAPGVASVKSKEDLAKKGKKKAGEDGKSSE